jgi:hypothetical protein
MTIGKLLICGLLAVGASIFVSCEAANTSTSKPSVGSSTATTQPAVTTVANSSVWITVKWKGQDKPHSYYEVYRGTTANFEPMYNNLVSPPGSKDTTFEDDKLSVGTTYYYKVYQRIAPATGPGDHIGDASATTPKNDD